MPITLNGTTGITTPNLNSDGTVTTSNLVNGTALAFRNKIINGDMRIDQRNAGATFSASSPVAYTLDRWSLGYSINSKFTIQQNAGAITPPNGFKNYAGITSSSAHSLVSSDYFTLQHVFEGNNCDDLNWGTASAVPVTLSFWVRSSLTGTFGGAMRNYAANRSYPFTYTINTPNTWERKTITIPGDTSGTWPSGSAGWGSLLFGLGVGSTFSGTAGVWTGSNFLSATGATSVVGTNGATFYITGVQLEAGSVATPFENRPIGTELALCQRYFQLINGATNYRVAGQFYTTTSCRIFCPSYAPFRASPTIGVTNLTGDAIGSGTTTFTGTTNSVSGVDAVSFDLTGGSPSRTIYQNVAFQGTLQISAEL